MVVIPLAGNDDDSVGENNTIYYISTYGNIVLPYSPSAFGANIVSNTCKDGQGVLVFDDVVTSIGDDAFLNCSSLASITIPDSVTSIGSHAFESCTSLKEVYCKPTIPPSANSLMFYNNASERKIYVPTESVKEYKSAKYWKDYVTDIVGYDFE